MAQSRAAGTSATADQSTSTEVAAILFVVIDSTPAPIPASIAPDEIAPYIFAKAWSPLLHCRFTADTGTLIGMPATSAAMRAPAAPAPACRTLPTHISPNASACRCERSITDASTVRNRISGVAFLKPPRFARHSGVRTAESITTSSGLARNISRWRWDDCRAVARWAASDADMRIGYGKSGRNVTATANARFKLGCWSFLC